MSGANIHGGPCQTACIVDECMVNVTIDNHCLSSENSPKERFTQRNSIQLRAMGKGLLQARAMRSGRYLTSESAKGIMHCDNKGQLQDWE